MVIFVSVDGRRYAEYRVGAGGSPFVLLLFFLSFSNSYFPKSLHIPFRNAHQQDSYMRVYSPPNFPAECLSLQECLSLCAIRASTHESVLNSLASGGRFASEILPH